MESDIFGFNTDFVTDSGKNFLVLTKDGLDTHEIIGFQIEMIVKNRIPGVVGLNVREKDLEIKLWYEISGLVTLSNFFKRQKVSKSDFILILKNITTTLINCKNYLLNDRFFVLDENIIYINPKSLQTYLVYIPCYRKTEFTDTFRKFLMNLIINTANIDTTDNFVQILLQEIKKDDLCLEGFRGNLDKLKKDKIKSSGDSNFTVGNDLEKGSLTTPGFFLESDKRIPAENNDDRKPPLPLKAKSSGNIFYLFMIITSVLVLAAVKLRASSLNSVLLFGLNMEGVGVGVTVLIMAVVFGLIVYFKLREPFSPNDCKSDDFCNQDFSIPSFPPKNSAELINVDETVLLNEEKKSSRLVSVNSGEVIVVNKAEFIIGRNRETCDHAIEHKSVGRAHASIKRDHEKYYLVDLDSRNGTYINGTRLVSNKPHELKENDLVAFANAEFYFK